MSDFVNLHVHSEYSILDGGSSVDEIFEYAKELGQDAVSLSDHGTLAGVYPAMNSSRETGVKLLAGVEAYISETDRFDRREIKARDDNTQVYNHLILIAKNDNGLKNLNKLSEISWTEGFYRKPRIDKEVLEKYGEDLIVTSACLNGLICKAIEEGNEEKAIENLKWFKNVFKDDFYVELQKANPIEINSKLLELADDLGIKSVAAADSHYARPDSKEFEDALLIVSSNPKQDKDVKYEDLKDLSAFEKYNKMYPDRFMTFQDLDLYLHSRKEMQEGFEFAGFDRPDLLDNTVEIAEKVKGYSHHKGLDLLPKPKNLNPQEKLRELVYAGIEGRYKEGRQDVVDRIEYELGVIEQKDFASYFLIVRDVINWAKEQGIEVGPARGSGAGSIVCYLTGITDIDPLKYGLLFERFINIDRNDFPDIDTDFEDKRRDEVKEYLQDRFGKDKVASISTFVYFKDKNSVRDAARVFGVPFGDVSKFLKNTETFEDLEKGKEGQWFRTKYPEVMPLADKFRGRIRGVGMHAAGMIVSNRPINEVAPIETRADPSDSKGARLPVIAHDMRTAEEIGFLKLDILGLKTLAVISDAIKHIEKRREVVIDRDKIPLNDKAVYKDLSNGFTQGVFQAESSAYTKLLQRMKVENFNELVASNALVRPGAMNAIGEDYIRKKQGYQQVRPIHPVYDEITKDTFGECLYQEQLMKLCVELAGMSWSDADRVRKIIGKSKGVEEMRVYQDQFIDGASEHIERGQAEKIWKSFEASASYMFNLSHSVAYSYISYWTAWLKHHYPLEYMFALITNTDMKKVDGKGSDYLLEAKRLGIRLLLPHVNRSEIDYAIEGQSIRFGLGSVKYISENVGSKIIKNRPYKSLEHFDEKRYEKKSGINSRAADSLNKIGALEFDDNPLTGNEPDYFYELLGIPSFSLDLPAQAAANLDKISDYDEDKVFIFSAMVHSIKVGTGWSRIEFLDGSGKVALFDVEKTEFEKGKLYLILVAGKSVTRAIPATNIKKMMHDPLIKFLEKEELNLRNGYKAVLSFNSKRSKAGKNYAKSVISDREKNLQEVMIFADKYPQALDKMKPGASVRVAITKMKNDNTLFVEGFYDNKE